MSLKLPCEFKRRETVLPHMDPPISTRVQKKTEKNFQYLQISSDLSAVRSASLR